MERIARSSIPPSPDVLDNPTTGAAGLLSLELFDELPPDEDPSLLLLVLVGVVVGVAVGCGVIVGPPPIPLGVGVAVG